jgi:hypothetical protein
LARVNNSNGPTLLSRESCPARVPADAPTSMTVHVKNDWLPYPASDWEIDSIGTFTNTHRAYLIVLLTYGDPSMAYGINTIESAAKRSTPS